MEQIRLLACVLVITVTALPIPASAWNIPTHMLSGIIAYQVLQQESPQTIDKVKAALEKHPWYANQWQARLQDVAICLAVVIIGNENDVQKRERATNRVANK